MTNDHSPVEQRSGADGGDDAQQRVGAVFWVTIAITLAFVLWGVLSLQSFTDVLGAVVGFITRNLGWAYMLITSFFLVFVIFLACSRYGKIKLGGPDDKPEFSNFAWFAMLFQAEWASASSSGASPNRCGTTETRRWAWRRRAPPRPPTWPCRPRFSTGRCTRG